MLYTKEFYETMEYFEKEAKNLIRMGSQGLKREDKENWKRQVYYCDGNTNDAFKLFLFGVSLGKAIGMSEIKILDKERPQIIQADDTIKAIVKGIEEKTGEKVVSVSGHLNKKECPYCGRTEPCEGSYPEGCFHPSRV